MRLLAALLLAGALVVNALANRLPLGGRTTGELSALYPNLFVPAGITFSIWGVIYLLLVAWAVAQFRPRTRAPGERLAPAFAASSLLNGAWLLAWHHERVLLSVGIMVALLLVLLRIHVLLEEGDRSPLLARAAFGIYLGWILVATIANVTALLVAWEWGGWGIPEAIWATLLVLVGGAAGLFTLWRFRSPWVGAAVTWALLGIVLNRWEDHPGIAAAAGISALLVTGLAVAVAWHSPGTPRPSTSTPGAPP